MSVTGRLLSCLGLLLVGQLAAARPAGAELVVLTDGRFLKVRAFELDGEQMRLTLPEGGRLTLSLARIERVVDDEIPLPAEEPPAEEVAPEARPAFSWRFEESHPVPSTPYGELIYEIARRHALNPVLVAAVVRAESAFDADAISPKGARGLMQLMPATGRRFGVSEWELFVPERNLEAGITYLRWLLERFDSDLHLALAAYNAGEGTVDRYRGVPPFRETLGYLARVLRFLGLDAQRDAAGEATTASRVAAGAR